MRAIEIADAIGKKDRVGREYARGQCCPRTRTVAAEHAVSHPCGQPRARCPVRGLVRAERASTVVHEIVLWYGVVERHGARCREQGRLRVGSCAGPPAPTWCVWDHDSSLRTWRHSRADRSRPVTAIETAACTTAPR